MTSVPSARWICLNRSEEIDVENRAAVRRFVNDHHIRLGDLIQFRDKDTSIFCIACYERCIERFAENGDVIMVDEHSIEEGEIGLIENPNGRDSDTVVIPKCVTSCMANAVSQYMHFCWIDDQMCLDLAGDDPFIVEHIGPDLPADWEFAVEFSAEGELESMELSIPGYPEEDIPVDADPTELHQRLKDRYLSNTPMLRYDLSIPLLPGVGLDERTGKFNRRIFDNFKCSLLEDVMPKTWYCEVVATSPESVFVVFDGPAKSENTFLVWLDKWFRSKPKAGFECSTGSAITRLIRYRHHRQVITALLVRQRLPRSIWGIMNEDVLRRVCKFLL